MSAMVQRNAAELPWVESVFPGCFSKKLFEYGSENLGRDGAAGEYTTLYKFDPGARYPAFALSRDGAVELLVLFGSLRVDDSDIREGTWIQLREQDGGWSIGSIDGCELLAIVRGRLELVRSA